MRYSMLGVFLFISNASFGAVTVTTLPIITVDKTSINEFSTPIAYYNNSIYTINVEPPLGKRTDPMSLRTVVKKMDLNGSKKTWESKLIDDQTIEDIYHTQASIALDKNGYIHIAYNMHNMPWQYSVSENPSDISNFIYYGDDLSLAEKALVKVLNKTPFPSIGTAAIPGNQITYPAFFSDKNGDLYVTYRFALKPKRSFSERVFSAGIARYNSINKNWIPIGGGISITHNDADWVDSSDNKNIISFASKNNWAVYLPRLAFDSNNNMHVSWLWRNEGAGVDATHPSYAYSPSNSNNFFSSSNREYSLPITLEEVELLDNNPSHKYSAISNIETSPNGDVYVILQPLGKPRVFYVLEKSTGKWSGPSQSPLSASTILIDNMGGQWAFATGLTVLNRKSNNDKWKVVYQDKGSKKFGFPKAIKIQNKNEFFVHSQSADQTTVKIYRINY